MVRNGETTMRWLGVAEDDVAAALTIQLVSEPAERRDGLPP
jgi:hypothetical protein